MEVFKGEDGYARSAKVMTSSTVVTRAKRQRERGIKVTRTVLTRPITKCVVLKCQGLKRCQEYSFEYDAFDIPAGHCKVAVNMEQT